MKPCDLLPSLLWQWDQYEAFGQAMASEAAQQVLSEQCQLEVVAAATTDCDLLDTAAYEHIFTCLFNLQDANAVLQLSLLRLRTSPDSTAQQYTAAVLLAVNAQVSWPSSRICNLYAAGLYDVTCNAFRPVNRCMSRCCAASTTLCMPAVQLG
jgi:hypothetical protein